MNRRTIAGLLLSLSFITCVSILFLGCEIDSAESSTRDVDINIQGFYSYVANNNNNRLVSQSSGSPILTMDLRQNGDQLEGIDNNGSIFKGTIGNVIESVATITLEGQTTAGEVGTISGQITVEGTTGKMEGSWIEPSLYGTVYGEGTVPPAPTNAPTTNATASVNLVASSSSISVGNAVTLTASGASSYNWSSSGSASGTFGEGSPSDGNNSWAATTTGTVTITATDASDASDADSVNVTVNP